ncbi:enoyl-CoA hydratase [Bryocella elongata]|uniref:enoyl-CoA hydratase n=1 Tax=Bryocella elongata TaxID=863522 RepID=A0A1H5XYE4_9BACT|nr:enoyl-CoA hydratase [Bryocella elongata]SEG16652.1 enoyl-CoA hydratase [Bryocella elongata]
MAETIVLERRGRVAWITLNRPQALNALNEQVMLEVTATLLELDRDEAIGCSVLTGSAKAFAAGADIREMQPQSFAEMFGTDWIGGWDAMTRVRKPVIAAVAGYALGGGCEVAMMCDIVLAADTAKFGQPEIKLGVIPGMGATQRLTRLIGKSRAMELFLTGRMMDAAEAERLGLATRVVPAGELEAETMKLAEAIAAMPLQAVLMMKEAVNRSFETPLHEGLLFERRLFQSAFATEDRTEGMTAFVEKRAPVWKHR